MRFENIDPRSTFQVTPAGDAHKNRSGDFTGEFLRVGKFRSILPGIDQAGHANRRDELLITSTPQIQVAAVPGDQGARVVAQHAGF